MKQGSKQPRTGAGTTGLLGNLTPRQFLSRHWQKKPVLIRGAIPGFQGPVSKSSLLRLAQSADLESRVVVRNGRKWDLEYGPFARSMLAQLPARNWTLLVQGLNLVLPEADALLQRFAFIPYARLDDVMVSYAAPGGGVGPHLDSYDVFLLQGAGRRRWRIGVPESTALREGLPLKILKDFRPQQEWILEPGDMLYLPPGYAHEGTALDACFTYSIGFRAPSNQELAQRFLDYLRDRVDLPGRLADPELQPARKPGALPGSMVAHARRALSGLRWDKELVEDFLARDLTEPKSHVVFAAPPAAMGPAAFDKALRRHGAALDAKSLMLYAGAHFYLNGEPVSGFSTTDSAVLKELADRRRCGPAAVSPALRALLRSWYLCGYLRIDGEIGQ